MNPDRAERLRQRAARQHGLHLPVPPRGGQPPADPESELAGARTLAEGFAATVARFGERCAVRCGRRRLTYRELDAAASSLAAAIQARTSAPQRPVGILLERSAELVTAAVAVLKTGSSYLPLEPMAPPARLGLIVADATPALVITTRELAGRLPADVPVCCVDDPDAEAKEAPFRKPSHIGPQTRAYVIFTSGTTGRPKGVEVSHGNVLRLFTTTEALFGFGCDDVWSLFHSFAFDFSVWEMWGALLYGGCVVVVPGEVARDPAAFRRLLRDEAVTVLNQTPTAFIPLRDEDLRHDDRLAARWLMFGGEVLHFSDLKPWVAKYGDRAPELVNMYGITETTVLNSYHRVSRADLEQDASLIGVPFPDLDFILVDEDLVPVPAGQPGEIVVTGPGVSLGYLNRPELTRERFVELTGRDGRPMRVYRSGDLAVLTASGAYEYRGRKDDQVKIRGHRVELGEVESALRSLPGVAEAAVVLRELPGSGPSLVAYLVPDASGQTPGVDLRRMLQRLLPDYMIPGSFALLTQLPRTDNGKLDRAALPDPGTGANETGPQLGAEQSDETGQSDETERRVLEIARGLLPTAAVTGTSDFFDVGGHSLLATRLLAGVRSAFDVEVTLREFFRSPTPRALAGLVRERRATTDRRPGPAALSLAPDGEYPPATSAQQRLYFLARLDPDSTAYSLHTALLLKGPLDVRALQRAFDAVLARHAPLRTVFRVVKGEPVQVVQPPGSLLLEPEDLAARPGLQWEEHIAELSAEESAQPFDLDQDLMVRTRLIRIAPELNALLVTVHHVAFDGWSNAVLGRELTVLYRQFKAAPGMQEIPLPPLSCTYADYAHSMRRWLASPAAGSDIEYWVKRLENLPVVHRLPLDEPRPARLTDTGDTLGYLVRGPAARALRRLCRDTNVTPFMLFAAALAVLLARRGSTDDVVLGAPVANRPRTELDGLIGLFVNTIVLRITLAGISTFEELLARVREQTLSDLAHQHVPFEVLVKRLNPERSTSHTPLFQIMLLVQNNAAMPLDMDGLEVTVLQPADQTVKVDLVLYVTENCDDFRFHWKYNTDLFHRETIAGLAAELDQFLSDLATQPGARRAPLELAAPPRSTPTDPARRRDGAEPAALRGQPRPHPPHPGVGLFRLHRHPGGAVPVFALPGALGFGSSFAPLAACFVDRSFYAIHTRDLVAALGDGLTLAALLTNCGQLIAATARGRPVHLAGHSIGGCLGFHLVEGLRQQGVPVASLVLLDTPPPAVLAAELPTSRAAALLAFLAHVAAVFPDAARQWGGQFQELHHSMTEEAILEWVERILGPPAMTIFDGGLGSAFHHYLRLVRLAWPEPAPLACPALLIKAGAGLRAPAGSASGWRQYLPGSLVEEQVTASHEEMLRGPRVQQVASLMRRFLAGHDTGPGTEQGPPR